MSVDDLFSGKEPVAVDPALELRPVRRWCWLASALNYVAFLAGLGLVFLRSAPLELLPPLAAAVISYGCVLLSLLAAPGAFASIWAWIRADEILTKARTGALSAVVGPPAFRMRQQAFALLIVSAVCLTVQMGALMIVLRGAPDAGA